MFDQFYSLVGCRADGPGFGRPMFLQIEEQKRASSTYMLYVGSKMGPVS